MSETHQHSHQEASETKPGLLGKLLGKVQEGTTTTDKTGVEHAGAGGNAFDHKGYTGLGGDKEEKAEKSEAKDGNWTKEYGKDGEISETQQGQEDRYATTHGEH